MNRLKKILLVILNVILWLPTKVIFATEDILAAAMYGVPTDPPDFYKPRISTIISGILVIIFIPFIIINGVCAYSKKGDNKEKNAKKIYKRFMLVEMVLVVVCMLLLFIFRNLYLIQMGDYNEELEGLENYILAVEILGGIICIANIIWNERKIIKKIGNEIKNSPLILFEILVLIILPMIMINMDILSLFTSFNDRDLIYNSFADVGCVLIVVIVLSILFRIWRKPKKYSDELLEKNANRKNITMIMVDFMAIILFGIFINIVKNGNAFEYIQISDFCIYEICLTGILWVIYNACNLIKYFKAKKK